MMTIPIWVYVTFVGILFSGYMTVKTAREDAANEAKEIKNQKAKSKFQAEN